jgi:hypothetical protein
MVNGQVSESNFHQVYADGNYVYDPAWSRAPIPQSEFVNQIQMLNPGADIGAFPAPPPPPAGVAAGGAIATGSGGINGAKELQRTQQ